MPIPPPRLDTRDYAQLLDDARAVARERCPEWTDMTAGDPGVVLLELFAYLTDAMIYRLNRLPERLYVAFLNLIGVSLEAPSAAAVVLRFNTSAPVAAALRIPRGTQVGLGAGSTSDTLRFLTASDAEITPATTSVEVAALACEEVAAELLGVSTGAPGQVLRVGAPPIIARANRGDQPVDVRDLSVGVGTEAGEPTDLSVGGVGFRLWQEVASFGDGDPRSEVYVVDRVAGTITFGPGGRDPVTGAPRPLAAVPAARRQIRAWYRHGGGAGGNVTADSLTRLVAPLPGVSVTNPAPASGGRDPESVADALRRGPAQLFALQRAVTVSDFELAARRATGSVARAKAITQADVWAHGTAGTVEVLLVPEADDPVGVSAATLTGLQTPDAIERVRVDLDMRRPLGTRCVVSWGHYKTVGVRARVVVHPAADPGESRNRLLARLGATINPLRTGPDQPGWRFGQALRVSDVYSALLSEPSVRFVENVTLSVEDVPDTEVRRLAADPSQPNTWYCAARGSVFRSMDDGEGWEVSASFAGETVEVVTTTPRRAGVVVATSVIDATRHSRIRMSWDCGENWQAVTTETDFHVEDMTLIPRDGQLVLLLATDRGLFEIGLKPGAAASPPSPILVDAANQTQGYYAVTHLQSDQGDVTVVVASQNQRGVLMSSRGGRPGTYQPIGLQGKDVRVLVVREHGPRRVLLAGITVEAADQPGEGVHLLEVQGNEMSARGWQPLTAGWDGGSCRGLVVIGDTLLAASHRMGVLRLDLRSTGASWQSPSVDSGLPLRDLPAGQTGRFEPVLALATTANRAGPSGQGSILLAGGRRGVRSSKDGGITYVSASERDFRERVTLPATWLFCSGAHQLEVDVARS